MRSFNLTGVRDKVESIFKWLYPGIGIKRWVFVIVLGVVLVILGASYLGTEEYWLPQVFDLIVVVSGVVILALGIQNMLHSFIAAFMPPSKENELVNILYLRSQLSKGPKVITVGGGTGLSTLLTGLKEYTSNITAVVTVADEGGSSGRLRQQFDILPPGDIRNCLVALADASSLMQNLFQFRFDKGSELAGHNFGNLFITVMTQVTGDFEKAIKETSKVLALRGQVIPSTLDNVALVAEYKDGTRVEGEHRIPKVLKPIERISLKPDSSVATPEAVKAIEEADLIILGPGSLYTSIIPNLLINGITEAIVSSRALKVYVCNIMTQPGETDGYSAFAHVKALVKHSHPRIFDYCIVNTGEISPEVIKRYEKENASAVAGDRRNIENMGYRVIGEDIAAVNGNIVRHDSMKLAKMILGFIEEI